MKGDNCSKHWDRIATGYYGNDRSYGLNGCEECMTKNSKSVIWRLYEVD